MNVNRTAPTSRLLSCALSALIFAIAAALVYISLSSSRANAVALAGPGAGCLGNERALHRFAELEDRRISALLTNLSEDIARIPAPQRGEVQQLWQEATLASQALSIALVETRNPDNPLPCEEQAEYVRGSLFAAQDLAEEIRVAVLDPLWEQANTPEPPAPAAPQPNAAPGTGSTSGTTF